VISDTVWQNVESLAASRSVAAAIRVETVEATDCAVRAVEEYALVATSARGVTGISHFGSTPRRAAAGNLKR
jgi:hypothetical protein